MSISTFYLLKRLLTSIFHFNLIFASLRRSSFSRIPLKRPCMVHKNTMCQHENKCILVAKKGCNLQWQISYALLFFEKNFLFLDQFFLFFDLDCQNLTAFGFDNHPDLKKERIDRGKEKVSLRKETAHASFAISVQRFSSY